MKFDLGALGLGTDREYGPERTLCADQESSVYGDLFYVSTVQKMQGKKRDQRVSPLSCR